MNQNKSNISVSSLHRISHYLNYLKFKQKEGYEKISSPIIARDLNLNEVLVRKDIALVTGGTGKPKTGRDIQELIDCIERFFGYDINTNAILIGAGHLGKALLNYNGFRDYRLSIVEAFDNNPLVIGTIINDVVVHDIDELLNMDFKEIVDIAIITVPGDVAQEICDIIIQKGIKSIWNFAPVPLNVSENVNIFNENMASSFAMLSIKMK